MTLFLTVSSFNCIFTQVPKTFNSTVALQVGFLKHLGDVATVLLDLVCLSFFMSFQTDWMMIRSDLCVEHWLLSDIHWIITINGKINVCYQQFTPGTHCLRDGRVAGLMCNCCGKIRFTSILSWGRGCGVVGPRT